MATVIVATDNQRAANGTPPPRGATLASWVCYASFTLLLALLYAGSEWWHLAGGFGFPSDPAWVRAVIARNLASGHGVCFNPGTSTAGAAGFSWIVALAFGGLVSANYIAAAKVLGVVALIVAAWLTWCVALDLLGDWRFAFLAGLLVIASPRMISQALGGTEAAWSALWLVGAIHWQAVAWEGSTKRRAVASLALGLAALSRPELIVLLPLALLDRWIISIRQHPSKRVAGMVGSLPELALAIAVVTPYLFFNLRVGGPWWQQPELALRQPPIWAWSLMTVKALWLDSPIVTTMALIGLPVAALFALRPKAKHPSLLLPMSAVVVLVLPRFIWRSASQENGLLTAAALTPVVAILGAAGLFLLYRGLQSASWRTERSLRSALVALRIGIVLACLMIFGFSLWLHQTAWRQHGFQVKKVTDLQGYLGRWAAEHLPSDASIASREVGAIGFASRRRMLDLGGSVSPDALPYMRRKGSPDTNLLAYLEKAKPSHLAIRPSDFPDLAGRPDLLTPLVTCMVTDPQTGGATTMALYETPWPPLSVQEIHRQTGLLERTKNK